VTFDDRILLGSVVLISLLSDANIKKCQSQASGHCLPRCPDLRAALDALAKAERRTLNAYVNILLEDHVAATKKRRSK
jgi:hypothetical protein